MIDKQYTVREIKYAKQALELKLYWLLSEEINKFESYYGININDITVNLNSFQEVGQMHVKSVINSVSLNIRV